jgi:hypothetical protein
MTPEIRPRPVLHDVLGGIEAEAGHSLLELLTKIS